MLRSRNRALAVYGFQVLLGIIAAPGDIAKLAGADVMVQAFQPVRTGRGVLTMCDGVEVVAASTLVATWRCGRRNAARGFDVVPF